MADGYLNFDTKINTDGFNRGVKTIGGLASKIGSGLTSKITKPAIVAASALAGMTLAKGWSRMTALDNAKVKLQAIGNSANDVTEIMANALASVKGTAYGMDEAATTAASAVAACIKPGKQLESYLTAVADAAAVAGTDMSSMGAIFNKVATQGKATNEVLQQMAEAGIPIYQYLADEIGCTAEEIFDMASRGEIDLATFQAAVETHIGGAAKAIGSSTISGAISNIGAAISRIGSNFLGSADDAGSFAGRILPLLNSLTSALGVVEERATGLGAKFAGMFGPLLDGLTAACDNFATLDSASQASIIKTAGLGTAFTVGLGPGLKLFGNLAEATGIAKKAIDKVPGSIKSIGSNVSDFSKSFGNLKDAILLPFEDLAPLFKEKLSGVLEGASELFQTGPGGQILSGAKSLASKISTGFGNIGPALSEKFPAITGKLSALSGKIGSFGKGIVDKFKVIAPAVSEHLGVIGDAFKPVISKIGGFAPAFIGAMGFTAIIGAVVAGLGLLYSQFGSQIDQLLLMVQTKGPEVITNFCNGIVAALPNLIAQGAALLNNLMLAITANLPAIVSGGFSIVSSLITGIAQQLPTLIPTALEMILTFVMSLLSNIDQLVDAGINLLIGLAQGIVNAIPQLIEKAPVIIGQLVSAIISNLPKILQAGIKILGMLATGLVQAIPQLIGKIPSIISQIKNAFTSVDWGTVGKNIISGIGRGILNGVSSLVDAAKSVAKKALDAAKDFLGIHSPSRVFRDQVGKMMALGIGVGFEKNIPVKSMNIGLQKAVNDLKKDVIFTTSAKSGKSVGRIKNDPIHDTGVDWDEWERRQRRINKERDNRPIYLGTDRLDRPLPKGAVPVW